MGTPTMVFISPYLMLLNNKKVLEDPELSVSLWISRTSRQPEHGPSVLMPPAGASRSGNLF